jgi:glycosyltransferase involved in cell wall biosynthesis
MGSRSTQTLPLARRQRKLRRVSYRVLHVDTERGWRGGERQALWLALELARRGHTSVMAARVGEPLAQRAAAAGVPVTDCSPLSELDLLAAYRLHRLMRTWKIDVVHAHTAHAVAVAALATMRLGIPMVVSRRVDFALRDNVGTRWKYGRATMIVAISRAVAAVLERSGVEADRIRVVPDGVDIHRRVAPASADVLASLGVPAGVPLVVQVAQLVGHKDPLNFVRAIAKARQTLPNVHGLLVGDGSLRGDVEREAHALGLDDVLHVAGYRQDADALLAAASVACLSSREEGMGSVLLDALAFGIPVAATRAGGIPEVIVDAECGVLADACDPSALGDAIARLLTDAALAAGCRAAGPKRAAEFSVERMADRTVAVYEEVVNAARGV